MTTNRRHPLRIWPSAAALLCFTVSASAGRVAPPPLPMGSAAIEVQAGASPVEKKRAERAHKHNDWHKKDYTRDDSLSAPRRADPVGTGPDKRPMN